MSAEETHEGPGVYGGWETHRGAKGACSAPDCEPQKPLISPGEDCDSVTIHLPEINYLDTQVWSADVGISLDALRDLRDAINAHLEALETNG